MQIRIDYPDGAGGRLRLAFAAPRRILAADRCHQVPAVIAAADEESRHGRWVVGFVAYEAAPAFDPALLVPAADPGVPLAWFAVFDRPLPAPIPESGASACTPWRLDVPRTRFDDAIARIRAGIAAGDYYQVNYTGRCHSRCTGDALALFESLRRAQPGGYGCCIDAGPWALLSVSPELFFERPEDGNLVTRPMKGTAPRHEDPMADQEAARRMQASEKERAENLMIVDLLRNDLARIAVLGSVRVPRLFAAEALPTAWQMTSTITCGTRPDTGLADIFAALFPCGSVTGAPKIAAMAAIAQLETSARGIYCGATGLIRPGGHATFSVGIRSVWLDRTAATATCGIGSGITLDSTPAGEFAEWQIKRRFLHRASAGFELLETLRLEAGEYLRLPGHLTRLAASAVHFGFPIDRPGLDQALTGMAATHPDGVWRVRLRVDRHGTCQVEAHPLDETTGPVDVVLAGSPIDSSDEFLGHKTTERQMYQRHLPPAGCFDTLLWNERGHLTEFTRGNLVVELDGRCLTPPLADGLLPGVLRAELLARGELIEASITAADLDRATGLWFINSLRGRLPVRVAAVGGEVAA